MITKNKKVANKKNVSENKKAPSTSLTTKKAEELPSFEDDNFRLSALKTARLSGVGVKVGTIANSGLYTIKTAKIGESGTPTILGTIFKAIASDREIIPAIEIKEVFYNSVAVNPPKDAKVASLVTKAIKTMETRNGKEYKNIKGLKSGVFSKIPEIIRSFTLES